MQVVYTIITVSSINISGCLISGGASTRAGKGDSLSKQAATPLKPRGGATFGTGLGDPGDDSESNFFCVACLHSSTLWCWALLPPALWLWHLHLNSLRVREISQAEVAGQAGCSTSVQPGKSLWGTSPFPLSSCHTGGISDSPAGLQMVAFGAIGYSLGSSVGTTSSVGSSVGVPPQWALS